MSGCTTKGVLHGNTINSSMVAVVPTDRAVGHFPPHPPFVPHQNPCVAETNHVYTWVWPMNVTSPQTWSAQASRAPTSSGQWNTLTPLSAPTVDAPNAFAARRTVRQPHSVMLHLLILVFTYSSWSKITCTDRVHGTICPRYKRAVGPIVLPCLHGSC